MYYTHRFFPWDRCRKDTKKVEWFSGTINKELAFVICKFHQKTKQASNKSICIYQNAINSYRIPSSWGLKYHLSFWLVSPQIPAMSKIDYD